jgi:hypothetical protein
LSFNVDKCSSGATRDIREFFPRNEFAVAHQRVKEHSCSRQIQPLREGRRSDCDPKGLLKNKLYN